MIFVDSGSGWKLPCGEVLSWELSTSRMLIWVDAMSDWVEIEVVLTFIGVRKLFKSWETDEFKKFSFFISFLEKYCNTWLFLCLYCPTKNSLQRLASCFWVLKIYFKVNFEVSINYNLILTVKIRFFMFHNVSWIFKTVFRHFDSFHVFQTNFGCSKLVFEYFKLISLSFISSTYS